MSSPKNMICAILGGHFFAINFYISVSLWIMRKIRNVVLHPARGNDRQTICSVQISCPCTPHSLSNTYNDARQAVNSWWSFLLAGWILPWSIDVRLKECRETATAVVLKCRVARSLGMAPNQPLGQPTAPWWHSWRGKMCTLYVPQSCQKHWQAAALLSLDSRLN